MKTFELDGRVTQAASADHRHVEEIRRYYEESWFDYRLLWLDKRTRAMHFGYAEPGSRDHARSLVALNHVMAERVGLRRGERVLDAGCGVGGTSMWLAECYGAEVVGVNLVEAHVERARRYVRERRLFEQVRFEVADYTATRFPDGAFDVAWFQESACHCPDKRALAREAARLLKPGGRLVMAEYTVSDEQEPNLRRWCEAWEMTLESQEGWRAALEDAGFADVSVETISARMARSIRRLHRVAAVLGPLDGALHRAGLRSPAQHRNVVGSRSLWPALVRGSWEYSLLSASVPTS